MKAHGIIMIDGGIATCRRFRDPRQWTYPRGILICTAADKSSVHFWHDRENSLAHVRRRTIDRNNEERHG